jgi:hypothetical protein
MGTYMLNKELQLDNDGISERAGLELLFVFENDGGVGLAEPEFLADDGVQDSVCKGFVVPGHRAFGGVVMLYRAVVLGEAGQLVVN